eukprot:TRINITY_DN45928_c0_g1_i1.p1 TRINITY_DN45928_c0_g1~~TRINITY_DN45928_c0_g1_i1.p1  ORF type:complete len:257 (-),score=0.18 TRINITY_DN45928_c0_g1_i1:135-905(-)
MSERSSPAPLPDEIVCPVTLDVMLDPVTSRRCGHTISRFAFELALRQRPTCPVCRAPTQVSDLIPNEEVRAMIERGGFKPPVPEVPEHLLRDRDGDIETGDEEPLLGPEVLERDDEGEETVHCVLFGAAFCCVALCLPGVLGALGALMWTVPQSVYYGGLMPQALSVICFALSAAALLCVCWIGCSICISSRPQDPLLREESRRRQRNLCCSVMCFTGLLLCVLLVFGAVAALRRWWLANETLTPTAMTFTPTSPF